MKTYVCIFMYDYDNILQNSSYNNICFGQICTENQNTHFICVIFFPKIVRLRDNVESIIESDRPLKTTQYRVIQKDGFNFLRLYFLNYTWYVNDLQNI
jgi:hypothetical protein